VTRKWIPVLIFMLVLTGLLVAGQVRERDKRVVQALKPLVKEGSTCVAASIQIALDPDTVDYDQAVRHFRKSLYDLDRQILAVEHLDDGAHPEITAALVYLKSGQSVVRELQRSTHAMKSVENARLRLAESDRPAEEWKQEASTAPTSFQRARRDLIELHTHRNATAARLAFAARMFRKNILRYQTALGPEFLAAPGMATTLIDRANQFRKR
jgi:hypothetical protein